MAIEGVTFETLDISLLGVEGHLCPSLINSIDDNLDSLNHQLC